MKGKRGVGLVIFAVLVTVCVCGCRSVSVSDYTAYQKEDFTAEASGEMNGVSFTALLSAVSTAEGEKMLSVSYLSSDALEGVRVELFPDGTVVVTRDGVELTSDRSAMEGLLAPVLLLFPEGDLQTVHKESGKTRVAFDDGCEILLSERLIPVSVSCEEIMFEIAWWESAENA